MARMSARVILCWFAPLAFLSGCQQFPYLGALGGSETKKPDTAGVLKSAEPRPSPGLVTEVKSPAVPLPQADPQSSGPVFDPALVKGLEPKKKAEGVLGTAVFEPGPRPANTHLTSGQAGPMLTAQLAPAGRKYDLVPQALQDILDSRPQDAVEKLKGYDKSTQEFLLNWMPAVVIILRKPIDQMNAQESAMLNELFSRWAQMVRNHTELVISKMCYCRRVQGFGAYETLPETHAFLSGTGRYGELVQVYVELKNFVSEKITEEDYVTKLACSLEIKDSRGERVKLYRDEPIHHFNRTETTHHCRSRLNDLHEHFSFNVPAMPPGTYLLTIQIVDETLPSHRRVAQQSLPFRVTPVATDVQQR